MKFVCLYLTFPIGVKQAQPAISDTKRLHLYNHGITHYRMTV